jgi:hypothetical protein
MNPLTAIAITSIIISGLTITIGTIARRSAKAERSQLP